LAFPRELRQDTVPLQDRSQRIPQLAARGVTEIAYQPAGPDIPRELTAVARMAGIA
jgi:hypothetical protein